MGLAKKLPSCEVERLEVGILKVAVIVGDQVWEQRQGDQSFH